MIKILDSNFKRLAIIKNAISPSIGKEINGEYTLDFECVLDEKASAYINENNFVEIEDNYFQIIYYQKIQNEDGTLKMKVECEHISYELNSSEYNLDFYTKIGTPTQILTELLSGTGFTVGTVEFSEVMTYSAPEKKSRRQLLMEFVVNIGAELDFNKKVVSLLTHIGSSSPKLLAKGKNVKVVSKTFDAKDGSVKVSYSVTPIQLQNMSLELGDEVLLIQKDLGIQEQLRIVRINYNPYDNIESGIELANFVFGLEDQIYRIETQQITKEKIYNGCKIGPDEGFVVERSDGKSKSIMNATDGISIYGDIGAGLTKNFYVGTDGRIKAKAIDIDGSGTFGGSVTAATITSSTISGGSITIGTANSVFKANGTDGIWLGDEHYADAPFKVSLAGAVSASNILITGGSIAIGSGNNVFKANGTDGIWLGDADFADAPFSVSLAGALTASNASIDGEFTTTRGGYVVTQLYADDSGGYIFINNPTGKRNIQIGSDPDYATGLVLVHNGETPVAGDQKVRAEMGILNATDYGYVGVSDNDAIRGLMRTTSDGSALYLYNSSNALKIALDAADASYIWMYNAAGYNVVDLGVSDGTYDTGHLYLSDGSGNVRAFIGVYSGDQTGYMQLYNTSDNVVVNAFVYTSYTYQTGALALKNNSGNIRALLYVDPDLLDGKLALYDASGNICLLRYNGTNLQASKSGGAWTNVV